MARQTIHWQQPGTEIHADPGATVALDRAQWEQLGAVFELVDDGDGETPGLAVFRVAADDGAITAGILDYGEPETFVLVPGTRAEQHRNAVAVLNALTDELIDRGTIVGVVPDPSGSCDASLLPAGYAGSLTQALRRHTSSAGYGSWKVVDLSTTVPDQSELHVSAKTRILVDHKQILGGVENLETSTHPLKAPSPPLVRRRAATRFTKGTAAPYARPGGKVMLFKKSAGHTGRAVVLAKNGEPVDVIWDE